MLVGRRHTCALSISSFFLKQILPLEPGSGSLKIAQIVRMGQILLSTVSQSWSESGVRCSYYFIYFFSKGGDSITNLLLSHLNEKHPVFVLHLLLHPATTGVALHATYNHQASFTQTRCEFCSAFTLSRVGQWPCCVSLLETISERELGTGICWNLFLLRKSSASPQHPFIK